jgi:hypothetical protein
MAAEIEDEVSAMGDSGAHGQPPESDQTLRERRRAAIASGGPRRRGPERDMFEMLGIGTVER